MNAEPLLTVHRNKTKIRNIAVIIYCLLFAGLAISIYLLYRHHLLVAGTTGNLDVCSAIFGKGCDSALGSTLSEQFGLSLPSWGIVYYLTLLILMALPGFVGSTYQLSTSVPSFLLSLAGFTGSMILLTII